MKTLKELDSWFNNLDSNELAKMFPGKFEKIMKSADPKKCTVNDFIREVKREWKSYSKDQKEWTYNEWNYYNI